MHIKIACVCGLESKASNPGIFWKLLKLNEQFNFKIHPDTT